MTKKLIVCILYEKGKTIEPDLCIKSVEKVADKIVIIDGSQDSSEHLCSDSKRKIKILHHRYRHEYKGANGQQRNVYLKYIQKNYDQDYCLVLDADEVLDDNFDKTILDQLDKSEAEIVLMSPHMRHTVYSLGTEDATVKRHYVNNRFFRIDKRLFYPESEHPILTLKPDKELKGFFNQNFDAFTIWHIAYSLQMFELRDKYLNHSKKSEIHTSDYLRKWYLSHIRGEYPISKFDISELPSALKKEFLIDDDELYFENRKELEMKHWVEAWQFKTFFKCRTALEIGCGMGHRVFTLNCMDVDTDGTDISTYAILNTPYKNIQHKMLVADITKSQINRDYDLIFAYDLLEHIPYEEIDGVLREIVKCGNSFLFSIPFKGDPNLLADKTHIIKESKEWWLNKLKEHDFIIEETPKHFLYFEQIIIAKSRRVEKELLK